MFISCLQPKSNDGENEQLTIEIKTDSVQLNTVLLKDYTPTKSKLGSGCNCKWKLQNLSPRTDLTFSNNRTPFSLDSLEKWSTNPKRFEIKSLLLIDFDTIPSQMGIFENVEMVKISGLNSKNITGLNLFSKLKIIDTEMLWEFDLSSSPKWLEKIEVIHANKTKFIGLTSFKQLPNLKELKIGFSGFEPFPKDFASLKCLNYFQTGAHRFGDIDLSEIDLQKLPCLKYIEFHSWWKNLKGIPKGIESIDKVKIHHSNLTEIEKATLNKTSG